jgi:LEA14-like dessication related protein
MKKPTTKLDSVEVKKLDTKGAQLMFGLAVENPNDFKLRVESVKYEIEIGGRKMTTESITTPTEVGPNTKSVVQLPITVQFADVFSSIGDFLRNEKTTYRIKGSARVGIISVPFDEKGEFKLAEGEIQHSKD